MVVGQTVKYNMKKRLGRGFSLEELKAAGVPRQLAPTIGVSVDHRRKNRSAEGFERNVQRLKEYLSNLIVFPKNAKKPKGEAGLAGARAGAGRARGGGMDAVVLGRPLLAARAAPRGRRAPRPALMPSPVRLSPAQPRTPRRPSARRRRSSRARCCPSPSRPRRPSSWP